jgi:hypothetical protein
MLQKNKKRQLHQSAVHEPDYDAILKIYRDYLSEPLENHETLDSKERVDTSYLPCQLYRAYSFWQPPQRIETLFLAESPPWSDKKNYFYNENYEPPDGKKNLRIILFDKLHIDVGGKDDNLKEFRRRKFFLSDSVKCVFRKKLPTDPPGARNKRIPDDLTERSVDLILKAEITSMEPRIIFLLGKTALKALRHIERFRPKLEDVSVGDCIEVGGTHIIVCYFLNERNLGKYEPEIDRAFRKFEALN